MKVSKVDIFEGKCKGKHFYCDFCTQAVKLGCSLRNSGSVNILQFIDTH